MAMPDFLDVSLDTANKFYTWGWRGSIAGAFITALAVVLLMWGTRVRDRDAESKTSLANTNAAAAIERAAKLEKEAAELRLTTVNLLADLESNKQHVADLQKHTAPRRLTSQQAKDILPLLTRLRGQPVAVACRMMDGESCDLALQIIDLLKQAGCTVPDLIKTSLNDYPGQIVVYKRGPRASEDVSKTILQAFQVTGMPAITEPVAPNSLGLWYEDVVHIIVGRKAP